MPEKKDLSYIERYKREDRGCLVVGLAVTGFGILCVDAVLLFFSFLLSYNAGPFFFFLSVLWCGLSAPVAFVMLGVAAYIANGKRCHACKNPVDSINVRMCPACKCQFLTPQEMRELAKPAAPAPPLPGAGPYAIESGPARPKAPTKKPVETSRTTKILGITALACLVVGGGVFEILTRITGVERPGTQQPAAAMEATYYPPITGQPAYPPPPPATASPAVDSDPEPAITTTAAPVPALTTPPAAPTVATAAEQPPSPPPVMSAQAMYRDEVKWLVRVVQWTPETSNGAASASARVTNGSKETLTAVVLTVFYYDKDSLPCGQKNVPIVGSWNRPLSPGETRDFFIDLSASAPACWTGATAGQVADVEWK